MASRKYVSCIKLHGFPLLPPLMTEEVKTEMKSLKEEALKIEVALALKRSNNFVKPDESDVNPSSASDSSYHSASPDKVPSIPQDTEFDCDTLPIDSPPKILERENPIGITPLVSPDIRMCNQILEDLLIKGKNLRDLSYSSSSEQARKSDLWNSYQCENLELISSKNPKHVEIRANSPAQKQKPPEEKLSPAGQSSKSKSPPAPLNVSLKPPSSGKSESPNISSCSDTNASTASKVLQYIQKVFSDALQREEMKQLESEIMQELESEMSPPDETLDSCDTFKNIENLPYIDEPDYQQYQTENDLSEIETESMRQASTPHQYFPTQNHPDNRGLSFIDFLMSDNEVTEHSKSSSHSQSDVTQKNTCLEPEVIIEEGSNDSSSHEKTPPRMIRRNSYTLESPSITVLTSLRSFGKPSGESEKKKVVKNLGNEWNFELIDNQVKPFEGTVYYDENLNPNRNSSTVSKKKRPVISESQLEDAIVKTQAYVRGFLVRRVMKTEYVKKLKDTIKDSLLCALALHSEEQVLSSDVHLHERLIRQVNAACYELHSIFFEWSVKERMALISGDRALLNKPKRHISRPPSKGSVLQRRSLSSSSGDQEKSRNRPAGKQPFRRSSLSKSAHPALVNP